MPQGFDYCRSQGGRIRTKRVNKNEYMRLCYLNGKSYAGEVRRYKKLKMIHKK